jgi:hypothetical protein
MAVAPHLDLAEKTELDQDSALLRFGDADPAPRWLPVCVQEK